MIYTLGTAVTLNTAVTDSGGNPTDATVALTVTAPDGTTPTVTPSHVGSAGSGLYEATFTPAQTGTWLYVWAATGTVVVTDDGQFTVSDPAPPLYASLDQLKRRVGRSDAVRDDELIEALDAASRQVDEDTGRRFWLDRIPVARTFNPRSRIVLTVEGEKLLVDDIGSAAGLIVEVGSGTSYSTITDYETGPDNALARGQAVTSLLRPWSYWCLSRLTRVRVTARWGWPTIPSQIVQATLLRAHRVYSRRGSPEGIAGFGDMGVVRVGRYDPDYDALIAPYVLDGFG